MRPISVMNRLNTNIFLPCKSQIISTNPFWSVWYDTPMLRSVLSTRHAHIYPPTPQKTPKNAALECLMMIYRLVWAQKLLLAATSHDAGGDSFWNQKSFFQKYHITDSYVVFYFVSPSLAASSDIAGSDTFSIPEISFQKISYTNSYVIFIFCIIVARSYITWCWRR